MIATVSSQESGQALASRVRWAVRDSGAGVGLAFVDESVEENAEAAYKLARDAEAAGLGAKDGEILDGAENKDGSDLVEALREGHLKLWYQRIVDIESGSLRAVSAQVRWDTVGGNAVSAERFWEMARTNGVAKDVTMWMLKTVATETAGVGREDLRVHVPCDLASTEDAAFPEMVMGALLGETRERAVLDVSGDARDLNSRMAANLRLVRGMGVQVALDGVTEGWSGLSRLAATEWDYVNLERSMCHRVSQKPRNEACVRAVVLLARECGAEVVCHGVENEEDADMLKRLGVTMAEGYLWSRPGPVRTIA